MEDCLAPDQLARLLHDLELVAPIALRTAAPRAHRLAWLLARIRSGDVRTDTEFQQRLCRHVGVRGKLRTRHDRLYVLVESLRPVAVPSFEHLLREVSALTGQVEKSTASHLLALFDPSQPAIDRDLRELLPRYGFATLGEAPPFEECVDYHRLLRRLFRQVIGSPGRPGATARIDALLGPSAAALSDEAKLGLQLSHSRRPIALLPSAASQHPVAPLPRPKLVTTPPPCAARFHHCR
jgi:hypothetical protein